MASGERLTGRDRGREVERPPTGMALGPHCVRATTWMSTQGGFHETHAFDFQHRRHNRAGVRRSVCAGADRAGFAASAIGRGDAYAAVPDHTDLQSGGPTTAAAHP